ncbi:low-temperature-induced 65 kDa protein-like isoform X2 [Salvia miltiorrhiza]|uniref:low-temperature-induced 65 kDa protein-like isoform X2 n=1 Tax=Salvia miltiorrhiza TaxID=226208 RepID=UPI0025AB93EE|nr:low-temperature-induced 65 kDa protein-like isoform X2 [Salvia miltiorrhiza]
MEAQLHGHEEHSVHQSTNLVEESNTVPNNSPANLPHSTSTATEKRSDDGQNSRSNPVSEQNNPKGEDSRDTMAGKVSSGSGAVADKPNATKSMKEYLWEKLKPGDDDKALSEAITHAFQKKAKRGKVTVSKEVAERLGTTQENKREGEDALAAGEHSTGQGVAERLQNAFTSWLSKSNGIQTAQDSIANARF